MGKVTITVLYSSNVAYGPSDSSMYPLVTTVAAKATVTAV